MRRTTELVVGHLAEAIVAHYGDGDEGMLITCVHQREQRRFGGTVSLTETHIDGPFVMLKNTMSKQSTRRAAGEREHPKDTERASHLLEERR